MKNKLIVILCLFSLNSFADVEKNSFVSNLREFSEKILGNDLTIKIFGEDPNQIELPQIPTITTNAKSTESYDKEAENHSFKKEDLERYNIAFLEEAFELIRGAKINADELAKWMNVMSQGATREGVYRALVLDDVYRGLENYDKETKEETAIFVINYFGKYLDRKTDKETLTKTNFYALKRVVVEKTLEILDVMYMKNKDDFYKWYAVFSADMAKDYSVRFTSKVRQSTSAQKQYQWATSVPSQFVKSEVILKLNLLMNSINGI